MQCEPNSEIWRQLENRVFERTGEMPIVNYEHKYLVHFCGSKPNKKSCTNKTLSLNIRIKKMLLLTLRLFWVCDKNRNYCFETECIVYVHNTQQHYSPILILQFFFRFNLIALLCVYWNSCSISWKTGWNRQYLNVVCKLQSSNLYLLLVSCNRLLIKLGDISRWCAPH